MVKWIHLTFNNYQHIHYSMNHKKLQLLENQIFIAHRGNTQGANIKENDPEYINETLQQHGSVEVDVWKIDSEWYLGHDGPQYKVDLAFLKHEALWCHAKTLPTLNCLLQQGIHTFFHDTDRGTLTSRGFIWTFPGEQLTQRSIAVMPELSSWSQEDIINCAGVCSDYKCE